MKKFGFLFLASTFLFLVPLVSLHAEDSVNYGSIVLNSNGTLDSGNFSAVWDLTTCELVINFTYDAIGLDGTDGDPLSHAWAELGIRAVGSANFNPSGAGVWLSTDFPYSAGAFDPDPNLDLDDKLLLQRAGGQGEGAYNLPSVPPTPGNNHRFWFDRDEVDQWQAQNPLAIDGGTYNTAGIYNIVIRLASTDASNGTAYMTINGLEQGFETNGDWTNMELNPAGMTFSGDMAKMQVFYGLYGYGAEHSVEFENISVNGCAAEITIGDCVPNIPSLSPEQQGQLYGMIATCEAAAENHGDFVSCVAWETKTLKNDGILTGKEMGSIVSCAAQSDISKD